MTVIEIGQIPLSKSASKIASTIINNMEGHVVLGIKTLYTRCMEL